MRRWCCRTCSSQLEQHERLDVAVVAVGVAVHRPVGGPGAAARPADQAQGAQEVLLGVLAHLVGHHDQRGAVRVLRAEHAASGALIGAGLRSTSAMRSNRQRNASARRDDERAAHPAAHVHGTPVQPAILPHRALPSGDTGRDGRQVQGQAARPHPRRQHLLRGDVQRRQAEQPADAGDHGERPPPGSSTATRRAAPGRGRRARSRRRTRGRRSAARAPAAPPRPWPPRRARCRRTGCRGRPSPSSGPGWRTRASAT